MSIALNNAEKPNILDGINCSKAILTDATGWQNQNQLPTNIQSQIIAFYPVQQLSHAVQTLEQAIDQMGGQWEPSYTDDFLSNPHKIKAYSAALEKGSNLPSLSRRYKQRQLDLLQCLLPTILRVADVHISGSFDDEGGYYFDNLCLGPTWTKQHSTGYSQELSLFVISYEYFYVHFEWEKLKDEAEQDVEEFVNWLWKISDDLPVPFVNEDQTAIKPLTNWTEEEKSNFAAFFVDNWEVGYSEELCDLRELVSSAYPISIGGEFIWTTWSNIKSSVC